MDCHAGRIKPDGTKTKLCLSCLTRSSKARTSKRNHTNLKEKESPRVKKKRKTSSNQDTSSKQTDKEDTLIIPITNRRDINNDLAPQLILQPPTDSTMNGWLTLPKSPHTLPTLPSSPLRLLDLSLPVLIPLSHSLPMQSATLSMQSATQAFESIDRSLNHIAHLTAELKAIKHQSIDDTRINSVPKSNPVASHLTPITPTLTNRQRSFVKMLIPITTLDADYVISNIFTKVMVQDLRRRFSETQPTAVEIDF